MKNTPKVDARPAAAYLARAAADCGIHQPMVPLPSLEVAVCIIPELLCLIDALVAEIREQSDRNPEQVLDEAWMRIDAIEAR